MRWSLRKGASRGLVLPCRRVKQFRLAVAGRPSLRLLGVVVHWRFELSGLSSRGEEAQLQPSTRALCTLLPDGNML
jgi:hypothetical protein